ncbi:MAG: hypothetical protein NC411_04725 [Bacteroides sp.]|nr:hypothetical protein [Bacteroides sp.]
MPARLFSRAFRLRGADDLTATISLHPRQYVPHTKRLRNIRGDDAEAW